MKRVGVLALLVLFVVAAPAQVKFGAGVHAGMSFAMFPKPSDEYYGFGWGFGAQGDVSLMKYLTLRLNFDYHMFASDKSAFKFYDQNGAPVTGISVDGATAGIIGITVNGLGKLPLGTVTPYALLGFGIHMMSVSDLEWSYQGQSGSVSMADSETDFGINFGAGAEFAISKQVTLFGEVKYVLIFSSEETNAQTGQKTGGTTGHLPITFGVTYWF
jgi:opacity protein-like surface antigen